MKTLYLLRHAKSSWDYPDLKDHDRPLNKRGKRDATLMAKVLKKSGAGPDLIISSTAVRALEFARIIADEFGYKKKHIDLTRDLYMADEDQMLGVVRSLPDELDTVFMIGHNPDITYFANSLSNSSIDNIPTSGVVKIEFDTGKWSDTGFGKGRLVSFDYPKKNL